MVKYNLRIWFYWMKLFLFFIVGGNEYEYMFRNKLWYYIEYFIIYGSFMVLFVIF